MAKPSKRKPSPPPVALSSAPDPRTAMLRRVLLGFVTALIVARPFVLGEDPGLLTRLSGTANLVLSVLWFMAAVGWAGWRAWSRQSSKLGGWVEISLAVVVVVVFFSALTSAHYQHPALLIGWEWVVFLLAFLLVRQLVQTEDDARGLLAALVATGICLSVYAIYQAAVELPKNRALLDDPEQLRQSLASLYPGAATTDEAQLANWKKRLEMDHAFATFAHPNAFAGYLALLLPAALGWVLTWRTKPQSKQRRLLLCAGVGLLAIGLWLTHSRGGILAVGLAGGGALIWIGTAGWRPSRRWGLLAALAVLIVLVPLAASLNARGAEAVHKAVHSFDLRVEYWKATWGVIRDHAWLGVGPGNFGRHYPRYMDPAALEKVQDPHNFIFEMWATCGVLGSMALLATFAIFFRLLRSRPLAPLSATPMTDTRTIRWEFYLGGMAGLVLGFILRAGEMAAGDVLSEGLLSAGRAAVWIVAFALLEQTPWLDPGRQGLSPWPLLLGAGVVAMILNLCVSGGISWPSVAQPLWIVMALAMGPVGTGGTATRLSLARVWLPLPVLAGLGLAYFALVYFPVTHCAADLASARMHFGEDPELPGWRNTVEPRWHEEMKTASAADRNRPSVQAAAYLKRYILDPLENAARDDPGDSVPHVELAYWYQELGKLRLGIGSPFITALDHARIAQRLDPNGRDGYLAEYTLHRLLAEGSGARALDEASHAARTLQAIVRLDPTEARLRYDLAQAFFGARDRVRGLSEAERALQLDAVAPPERRLNDNQRRQAQEWLK